MDRMGIEGILKYFLVCRLLAMLPIFSYYLFVTKKKRADWNVGILYFILKVKEILRGADVVLKLCKIALDKEFGKADFVLNQNVGSDS